MFKPMGGDDPMLVEKVDNDKWLEVYNFKEGKIVAGRMDRWINGKFRSPINAKDGLSIKDRVDPRERRILNFVVPLIYPEKPRQITKVVGNTIFGFLSGKYVVN